MSNAIYAQYPTEIQDIIKQLYYTEDCEIDFHDDFSKTFWVYLFFKSTKAWKLLFKNSMTFPFFFFMSIRTLNVTIGAGRVRLSNQTKLYVRVDN